MKYVFYLATMSSQELEGGSLSQIWINIVLPPTLWNNEMIDREHFLNITDSSLHWPRLLLFFAFFLQWSITAKGPNTQALSSIQTGIVFLRKESE